MGEGNWYQATHVENTPRMRHELIVEKLPARNFDLEHEINNFIGASISIPPAWKRSEPNVGPRKKLVIFASGIDSAELSLFYRGSELTDSSAKFLKQLLQDNSGLRVAKTLLPTDIKNLTEVLGTSTAGDNQFVNSLKPPDQRAPAFHLLSAQLIPVNGKTVLEVRGHFFDQSGAKGKEYGGIFVSSGADGTSIRELFLQADDLSTFSKHEMEYRRAVQSIKW